MDHLVVLPPIASRTRRALMNFADYRSISTEQLLEMARGLPGGRKIYLPDRVTIIAFLLGPRPADLT
jgi:hypothetical protein